MEGVLRTRGGTLIKSHWSSDEVADADALAIDSVAAVVIYFMRYNSVCTYMHIHPPLPHHHHSNFDHEKSNLKNKKTNKR